MGETDRSIFLVDPSTALATRCLVLLLVVTVVVVIIVIVFCNYVYFRPDYGRTRIIITIIIIFFMFGIIIAVDYGRRLLLYPGNSIIDVGFLALHW